MVDYTKNIEKAVLSSIIFNNENFKDIANILDSSDFFDEKHKVIYKIMGDLDDRDEPIEETFLLKNGADETALIEIMAVHAITNAVAYSKELKRDSLQRQIKLLTLKLTENYDGKLINLINELNEKLQNVDEFKKLKVLNLDFFKKKKHKYVDIENAKADYLLDNFIVKGEITMIAARPAVGKSLTTFAISNMALKMNKIKTVFYIDGDNSNTTIKARNIHKVTKDNDNFQYFNSLNNNEYSEIIRELLRTDLTDCLIVFDTIKNFMLGGDRDKNKDVSKVMNMLKQLRNNGATIIFLHHSNKPQKDVEDLMYAGSSAWEEDTSNAFILKKNEDKNAFIFYKFKARTGELEDQAFTYDSENHWLNPFDLEDAVRTKEDEEIVVEVVDFISGCHKAPIWSDIYNYLIENGYEKNKSSKAIKNGEGKLWRVEKGSRNNQKLYSLIEQVKKEPIKTVFESKSLKVTSGTPISSGSPFYGLSEFSDGSREVREVKQILPILANDKFPEIPFIE